MAVFFPATSTGAGPRFTFTASGDSLFVMPTVTLGSTTGSVISFGAFTDVEVMVRGTLVSAATIHLPTNSTFTVATGGTFASFAEVGYAGLWFNGANSVAQIDGSLDAPEAVAIYSEGGGNTVTVTGTVSGGAGAVILGVGGATKDVLVNSGSILAGSVGDAVNDARNNNGVYIEGASTRVINLAGGEITATSSEGDGVRITASGAYSVVENHGTITALSFGIDIYTTTNPLASFSVINTGVISGGAGALNAETSIGNVFVRNSGLMIGSVVLGDGDDIFDGRDGSIDGGWYGWAGDDTYDGRGASSIFGAILGDVGNDKLMGGDGDETIYGEDDRDTITGGGGDDLLYGGASYDSLSGGAGNDILYGGAGPLIARGGEGDDQFIIDFAATDFFVAGYGGSGDDLFYGGSVRDDIFAESGDDTVYAGLGNDFVTGGAGDDLIDGSDGADTLNGGAGDDTIQHFAGDGVLSGGRGFDLLSGGDGNDRIDGGADDDTLDGGKGRDTLLGGSGNDTLIGGQSRDEMTGGLGADVFVMVSTGDSGTTSVLRDLITDFASGADKVDLAQIDANALLGGNQAFSFIGSAAFSGVSGQLRYASGLLSADTNGDSLEDMVVEFQGGVALLGGDIIL